jgi:hypothetical protein
MALGRNITIRNLHAALRTCSLRTDEPGQVWNVMMMMMMMMKMMMTTTTIKALTLNRQCSSMRCSAAISTTT